MGAHYSLGILCTYVLIFVKQNVYVRIVAASIWSAHPGAVARGTTSYSTKARQILCTERDVGLLYMLMWTQ
jgi:hypothetical protein